MPYGLRTWDLNAPPPEEIECDIVICHNVLMYSPAPSYWIKNIRSKCNLFIFQDVAFRRRSLSPPFLGLDCDNIRYRREEQNNPNIQPTYILNRENILLYYSEYLGLPNHFHDIAKDLPVHIVCAIQGERPTGFGKRILLRNLINLKLLIIYKLLAKLLSK
jgi:hypothetical protein